jgi:hypothetical protein
MYGIVKPTCCSTKPHNKVVHAIKHVILPILDATAFMSEDAQILTLVESYIDGFCIYDALTGQECFVLLDLIKLRVHSGCIYFMSRLAS